MTTEPSVRMKYVLPPGTEHYDFVNTDIAPVLLHKFQFHHFSY